MRREDLDDLHLLRISCRADSVSFSRAPWTRMRWKPGPFVIFHDLHVKRLIACTVNALLLGLRLSSRIGRRPGFSSTVFEGTGHVIISLISLFPLFLSSSPSNVFKSTLGTSDDLNYDLSYPLAG